MAETEKKKPLKLRAPKLKTKSLLWWSAAATMAVILAKVLVSGVTLSVSGQSVVFGSIDSGLIMALLTPTLTALVAQGHSSLIDKDGDGIPD
jgi:hypothetical protein